MAPLAEAGPGLLSFVTGHLASQAEVLDASVLELYRGRRRRGGPR